MLTKEQLEKMSTKRILAYKKKWNRATPTEYLLDKEYEELWRSHMILIKSVLATREHVAK